MREMPWSLFFGLFLAAMVITALGHQLYDDGSYLTGEGAGRYETDSVLSPYEVANKRALMALSRFKPFASAFTRSPAFFPEAHRYAARSYLSGIDRNSVTVADRRDRPLQNPMRFGR